MNIWIERQEVLDILTDMGIDTTPWTINSYAKLDQEIYRAQREFERLTRRKIERNTITEKINGTGTDTIVLRYYPVVSITQIKVENLPGYPYTLTVAEYRLDEETGVLSLLSTLPFLISFFPEGKLNIEATYVYGYLIADIPQDLKDAIIYMVVIRAIMRTPADWEKLGLKGIRIAQYAEQYGYTSGVQGKKTTMSGIYGPQKEDWGRVIQDTIARYKRIPVV